jgi:hypothetical protein
MQFNVPQFIDVEDKILGPLTLKQFFLAIGGGIILLILWYMFKLWFVAIVGLPIILGILAAIFIKINGRPFPTFFKSWLTYWASPRLFVWKKEIKK